jgi:hypothetical protein
VTIPIVRHQAKIEPPLANLHDNTGAGETLVPFPQAAVLTIIAEVTIHAETVQGKALEASGFTEIIFSDFPNAQ